MSIAIVAAATAAIVGFLGDAYHLYWGFVLEDDRSDLLETPLYRAHGIAIAAAYGLALLALPGFALRLPKGAMAPLAAGIVVAFVGTVLVAGDYWAESVVTPGVVADSPGLADEDATGLHLMLVILAFALHAIGWLLVAVGAGRSGAPKWLAVLLGIGAVVAFTPLPGSNLLLFAALGAAAVWMRSPPTGRPSSATGRST
ncbi:MAG TPA: hypothetical protein VJ874_01780 [Candidatus Thermoplasmatota archaeon]|nr:hypothetical protein [Candidatus Thermoplasmatota archaeon]